MGPVVDPTPQPVRVVREPHPLGPGDVARIMTVLVGSAFLFASLVSPWWTRGVTFKPGTAARDLHLPGVEGLYANYGPFRTPGSLAGFTTDSSRAAAVSILGVALLLCGAFLAGHHLVRWGRASGRFDVSASAAVRFAMAAFGLGLFAVLWGLFFLPLLGTHPGLLWGGEYHPDGIDAVFEVNRYANVGFYLGIVGAVAYPGFFWVDAARARASATRPTPAPDLPPPSLVGPYGA